MRAGWLGKLIRDDLRDPEPGSPRRHPGRTPVAVLCAMALVAGCGGSRAASESTPVTIHAGQVNLQLPPGWKVTKNGAVRPAVDGTGAPGAAGASAAAGAGAVPLAKEDPTTSFFKAVGIFQSCLKDLGVKFIGVPDATNPSSPTNDPTYIKGLSTCAAKSNILKALKDVQTAQDNLTPAQVKQQNEAYLKWRDCMIGRGWGIPEPTPDSKGRLFSFGSAGSGVPQFTPPPGQDIVSSPDVQVCAAQAQKEVGPSGNGG